MRSDKSDIENIFEKRLKQLEAEPLKETWEKIERKLDRAEDRRTIAQKPAVKLLLLAAAAISTVVISTLFYLQSRNPDFIALHQKEKVIAPVIAPNGPVPAGKGQKTGPFIIENSGETDRREAHLASTSQSLITERAGETQREIVLPDSSRIYMHSGSEISYAEDFINNKRVVYMTGEVFFEVKHRNGMPFVIHTGQSKTEVLGTSFLIRADKKTGKDEIYVNTGKVRFSSLKGSHERVILLAGDQAVAVQAGMVHSMPIQDVNYAAWKTGRIVFKGARMEEVLRTLGKYYDVKMEVADASLLNCTYTGVFEKMDLTETIRMLSISFNISFDDQQGKYIVSGKSGS